MFTGTPSLYMPADQVEIHLSSWCDLVNKYIVSKSLAVFPDMEKFHKCFYFYYILLQIHPFADGNGRLAWMFVKWFLGHLPEDPIDNDELCWTLRNTNIGGESIYVEDIVLKSHALFTKDTWRLTKLFIDSYKSFFVK